MKESKGYRALQTQKQYLLYLFSGLITRLGDSIDAVVFGWMVYEITNSAAWLSLVAGFNVLPTILVTPFAAVIVDRWDKKKVLVVCDLGRGLLVALTVALYWAGRIQPWTILLLTMLNSTLEAFNTPAAATMLPRVLDSSLYDYGMGLRGTLSRAMELVGLGVAPILMGIGGISTALLVDGFLFALSGILLLWLKPTPEVTETVQERQSFFYEFRASFSYLKERRIVFFLCLSGVFLNFILAPLGSLQTAYVQESLGMGPEGMTVMGVGVTVGMMVSTWVFPMLKQKIRSSKIIRWGASVAGLGILSLWFITASAPGALQYGLLFIAVFIIGLGSAAINMVANVSFIEQVEAQYLGRIASIFNSMAMVGAPVMSFLSAPMVAVVPVAVFYGIMGIIVLGSSLFIYGHPITQQLDIPYVATDKTA